jgi:hypothetical protein
MVLQLFWQTDTSWKCFLELKEQLELEQYNSENLMSHGYAIAVGMLQY